MASLRITHPDPDKHRSALYDLMGKSFGDYWGGLEYCQNGYIDQSHYDWKTSRIGLLDGEIVSHFGIWNYHMRIGTDSVRTGGIGAVMTDHRHRKRGYMKATAEAGCEALEREEYGLSVLFGIPDFYQKFGYVSAWNATHISIYDHDLPAPSVRLKLRKVDFTSENDLDSIANRTNVALTGTAIRPTYHLNRHPDRWVCYRWQPLSDAAGGFVIIEQKDHLCSLVDCGGSAEEILAACITLVRRRGCFELKIPELHRRHPLFEALRPIPYRMIEQNNPTGGAMIRITNLVVCLKSIRKTLMRRLRESSFCDWTGSILVQKERESAVLVVSRRGIEVHDNAKAKSLGVRDKEHRIRAGEELAQFIIGLDAPERLMTRYRIRTSGDAKGLMYALFPEQSPSLGVWDHF